VLAIGKDKDPWVTEGCRHYGKLLSKHAKVAVTALPALKGVSALSPVEIMDREATVFERALGDEYLAALTHRGMSYDTASFARLLERLQTESRGAITFLIGGPYGLHERLMQRANLRVSLSPLTFSHQLVRLVLLEQLFRGFDILGGGSYHK
jgi:23S rRNA (pseudouridine1915-N3)-methyltransferase